MSIAGSGSASVLNNDVEAYIGAGASVNAGIPVANMAPDQGVIVQANENTSVLSVAGAISVAINTGKSESEEGSEGGSEDTDSTDESTSSTAVSVGIAAAVTLITNKVQAYIGYADNGTPLPTTPATTTVDAADGINVSATENTGILTFAIGGAVAASGGGEGGQGIGLAGAGSGDTITNDVEAYMLGGVDADAGLGGVALAATDTSKIAANGGGLGIGISTGDGGSTTGASLGVAIAINSVNNTVLAFIDGSQASGEATISLNASEDAAVWALTIGGAVAVSSGDSTSTSGAAAGAGSGNTVTNDTEARITNGSSVTTTTAGDVTLTSLDGSSIQAYAGGLGIAVAVSSDGNGIGIAVGVAAATNTVNSTVKSDIDSSTVTAAGAVKATATEAATITTYTLGGSVSVSSSESTSASAAVAGAYSQNSITDVVEADLNNDGGSGVTANDGAIVLAAQNTSDITANGGGVGIAIAAGSENGAAATIGFSAAQNTIIDTVESFISGSNATANAPAGTSREIDLSADEAANISALTIGGAVAGGGGENGVGVGAAGAGSGNSVTSTVWSFINSTSTVISQQTGAGIVVVGTPQAPSGPCSTNQARGPPAADGDINVSATDCASIVANAGGLGIAVGVGSDGAGVAASLGVAYASNSVTDDTEAFIDSSAVTAGGNLTVTALEAAGISSISVGGSVSVGGGEEAGVAVAIAVTVAQNSIDDTVRAYLSGLDNQAEPALGAVTLTAARTGSITAYVIAAAVSVAVGETAGVSVSGGGAAATNTILGGTDAYLLNSEVGAAGAVSVEASDSAAIAATVASLAASVGAGGTAGVGVAIGISVARNLIGWQSTGLASTTYTSDDLPGVLNTGDTVTVSDGPLAGQTFQYVGSTIDGNVLWDRQDFGDTSQWKQVTLSSGSSATYTTGSETQSVQNGDTVTVEAGQYAGDTFEYIGSSPLLGAVDLSVQSYGDPTAWEQVGMGNTGAQVEAYSAGSAITSGGSLTISSTETATINAVVVAASVAIAGGGDAGVGVSAGGVFTQNLIDEDVKAYVDGDGGLGISATSATITATDSAGIEVIAGAASVAAAIGQVGVAVSIGLAIALNTVSGNVAAYIANTPVGFSTTSGSISVTATESGIPVIDPNTSEQLDLTTYGVTGSDLDSLAELSSTNQQGTADLTALGTALADGGLSTSSSISVAPLNGSDPGVTPVVPGSAWEIVVQGGPTYIVTLVNGHLLVSQSTISAIAAAASLAASVGEVGISVAGAGAVAFNQISTDDNAYINGGTLSSAGAVTLTATSTASITATIAAFSAAIGIGGSVGVGVSIGVSIAQNEIGSSGALDQVQAYVLGASVSAGSALTLTATSAETIGAFVLAASAAVGGGGDVGIGASGSGVSATNGIAVDTAAFIDGDGATGISASSIGLTASDTSTIQAFAGAATVAAAFGAYAGVAVSIGIALAENDIGNVVAAFITGAGSVLDATSGSLALSASESAQIDALTWAASLAVGGGIGGVAVSGAGASALNDITTKTNAFISSSTNVSTAGSLTLIATDSSSLTAVVAAVSAAVAGGVGGVGGSVGIALARNIVGFSPNPSYSGYTYTSDETEALTSGNIVKVTSGPRAGDFYQYVGDTLSTPVALASEDYGNRQDWIQVGLTNAPAQVQAYIYDSGVTAGGALTQTATANQSINATDVAGSVAVGVGVGGVALTGAGAATENTIDDQVRAYIDGNADASAGVSAASIDLSAQDTSTINVLTGAISLGASAGGAATSLSIAVALAENDVSTEVEAFIQNAAAPVIATSGGITLSAQESATIGATTAAASISVAIGDVALGVAGAGADALNVINTTTAAYIAASIVDSVGVVSLSATTPAGLTITANVLAASAAIAGGGGAIGAAIGVALAQNLIGFNSDGSAANAEVIAYIDDSTVTTGRALSETATSNATITSQLFSGAVAISAGAAGGIGLGGAGFNALNRIAIDIAATITGAGADLHAASIAQNASDDSTISAIAGSAALAAGIGGAGIAVSVSQGIADNEISNTVTASIDGGSAAGAPAQASTEADHTSSETAAALAPGATVLVTSPPAPDYTASAAAPQVVSVTPGEVVTLAAGYAAGSYTTNGLSVGSGTNDDDRPG